MSRIVFIPSYVEQGVSMLNQAKQILAEIPTGVDAGIATIQGTNYNGGIPTFDTGSAASAEVSSLGGKIDYITQQIERYSNGGYIFQEGDLVILDPRDTESIEKYKKLGLKENQIMSLDNYESQRALATVGYMGAKFFEGAVESVGSIIDGFASALSLVTWGSWDDAIENFVQKDFASSAFDSLYAEGGAWEDMAKMSYSSTSSKWATAASVAEGFGSAVPYMAAGMAMAPVASAGAASVASSALGKAAVKVAINVAADAALGSLGGLGRGTNEGMDEGMTMNQAMATKGLQEVKQEVKMSVTAGLFGEALGEGVEILQNRGVRNALNEAAEVASREALTGLDNATLKAAGQVDSALDAVAKSADSMDSITTRLGADKYNKLISDPSEINKAVQDMAGKAGVDISDAKAVDDFVVKRVRDEVASSVRNAYTENIDEVFNAKYSNEIADIRKTVGSIDPTDSAKLSDLSKTSVDDYIVSKYGNDAITNPQARIEADAKLAQFNNASPAEAKQMILQNELDTFKMKNQADFTASIEQKIAGDVDAAVKKFDALSSAEKVDMGRTAIAKEAAVSPEYQAQLLKNQIPENTDAIASAIKGKLTDGLATDLSSKASKKFDKIFGGAKTLDNATANASTAMKNAIRDAAAQGKKLSIDEIQDIGKKAATKSIKYDALTTGNKAAKNALSEIDNDFAKDMRNVKKGKETLASVKDKYAPEVSNAKASPTPGNSKGISATTGQQAPGKGGAPTTGKSDAPTTGKGDAPTTGKGDAPTTGKGDVPTTGKGDVPTPEQARAKALDNAEQLASTSEGRQTLIEKGKNALDDPGNNPKIKETLAEKGRNIIEESANTPEGREALIEKGRNALGEYANSAEGRETLIEKGRNIIEESANTPEGRNALIEKGRNIIEESANTPEGRAALIEKGREIATQNEISRLKDLSKETGVDLLKDSSYLSNNIGLMKDDDFLKLAREAFDDDTLLKIGKENFDNDRLVQIGLENMDNDSLLKIGIDSFDNDKLAQIGLENVDENTLVEIGKNAMGDEAYSAAQKIDSDMNLNPGDTEVNPKTGDTGTTQKNGDTGTTQKTGDTPSPDTNKKKLPPSDNPDIDSKTKKQKEITDNFGRKTTIEEAKGKTKTQMKINEKDVEVDADVVEKTVTGPKGDQTRTTTTTAVDPNTGIKQTTTKYETIDPDGNVTVKEKIETTTNTYDTDGKIKKQEVETKYPERRIETKNADGTTSSKKIGNSTTTKEIEYSKNAKGNDVITTTSKTNGKTRTKVDEVSTVKTPDGKTATRTDTKIISDGKETIITRTQVDEHNFKTRTVTPDGKVKTIESSTLENGNVSRKITTREDLKKNIKTTKYEDYDLGTHTKTTAVIDEKGKMKVTVEEAALDVHNGGTGLKSAWNETASSRNFAQKWYSNRSGNFKTDVRDAFGETWITRRERMRYVKDEAGGLLHPIKRRNAYVARGRKELAQIYAEQMAKKNGGVITDEIMEAATKKANNKWNFFQTAKAKKLGKEAIFDEGVARGLREVVKEAHQEGGEALKRAAAKEAVARAVAGVVGVPLVYNMFGGGGDATESTLPPVIDTTPPDTVPPYNPPGGGPSPSPGPGTDGDDGGTTEPTDTITDPSAVDPNETPTDSMTPTEPTDNIIEEDIIAGVTDNNPGGDENTGGNNGGGGYWGPGGGQSFDDSVTEEILGDDLTDEDLLLGDEDLEGLEDEDDIYTIPLASGNSSTSKVTKDGINPIPILAGLGLVAAAGVGAKIYMDNKKNNENGEDDEFMDDSEFEDFSSKDSDLIADEWTGEETMNENTDEGLDYERPSFYSDTLGDEI